RRPSADPALSRPLAARRSERLPRYPVGTVKRLLALAATSLAAASAAGATAFPGLMTGPPPWPANASQLRARLALLGLPALGAEGQVLHIHQHLDLFVNGRRVVVPQ